MNFTTWLSLAIGVFAFFFVLAFALYPHGAVSLAGYQINQTTNGVKATILTNNVQLVYYLNDNNYCFVSVNGQPYFSYPAIPNALKTIVLKYNPFSVLC